MLLLLFGLVLFLAPHSIRIHSEARRAGLIDRWGPGAYKGLYSVVSLIGLVLIVRGYGAARAAPIELWSAWSAGRHVAALASLIAFILIAAAYVPRNTISARLRHPMVLGVKIWALGHLVANHTLADLLLFGSLLVWAVFSFRAARKRDAIAMASIADATAHEAPATSRLADALAVALGLAAYGAFAFHFHASLIGVRPFG